MSGDESVDVVGAAMENELEIRLGAAIFWSESESGQAMALERGSKKVCPEFLEWFHLSSMNQCWGCMLNLPSQILCLLNIPHILQLASKARKY
jgi:hypothetical protein